MNGVVGAQAVTFGKLACETRERLRDIELVDCPPQCLDPASG